MPPITALLTLLLAAPPLHVAAPSRALPDPPNFLLVVLDDLGDELLDAACTPTLDSLSDRGLTLANFYANPVCSPTRAALVTGRYGLRTGIGQAIHPASEVALPLAETTIAERLRPTHRRWAVGKWHLAPETWPGYELHANWQGFGWFAGTTNSLNGPESYYDYDLIVQGQVLPQGLYATTLVTHLAVHRASRPGPWLGWVGYHAPHSPFDEPPAALVKCMPSPAPTDPYYVALRMVDALDTELARLLDALPPDTYVFVVSDNGTAPMAVPPGADPSRVKRSVYEGGVNVPAWVLGPGVPVATVQAPVAAVDVPATIADLAGVPFRGDGVSFAPYLRGNFKPVRNHAYVEMFSPNQPPGVFAPDQWERAVIRADGWKLIRRDDGRPDELYHLPTDPAEQVPLDDPTRHAELSALLANLGAD